MFEKSIKEELLKMKESITTKYISFFNDGTTSIENGEYVNSNLVKLRIIVWMILNSNKFL